MTLESLSPRGQLLARAMQRNLELIREHEKVSPSEAELLIAMLVSHIRSSRPQLLLTGGAP